MALSLHKNIQERYRPRRFRPIFLHGLSETLQDSTEIETVEAFALGQGVLSVFGHAAVDELFPGEGAGAKLEEGGGPRHGYFLDGPHAGEPGVIEKIVDEMPGTDTIHIPGREV